MKTIRILFPLVEVLSDFVAGKAVFRAFYTADLKGNKPSVRQRVRTEYPDFGTKSVEGCRQALCRKLQRHLAFLLSAVPLHGKMPSSYEVRRDLQGIVKRYISRKGSTDTVPVTDKSTNDLAEECACRSGASAQPRKTLSLAGKRIEQPQRFLSPRLEPVLCEVLNRAAGIAFSVCDIVFPDGHMARSEKLAAVCRLTLCPFGIQRSHAKA